MRYDIKKSLSLILTLVIPFSFSTSLYCDSFVAYAADTSAKTAEKEQYTQISKREYDICKYLFQKEYDALDALPKSVSFETAKKWFKDGLDACDDMDKYYDPINDVYNVPSDSKEAVNFGYGKDGLLVCFVDEEWLLDELEKLDDYTDWNFPEAFDKDKLEKDIDEQQKKFDESKKQTPPRDPLIIHFSDEEKIVLTNIENGVYFDLDNNGFAEKTSWIGTEEGFLVIDLNDNGKIDNGGELFGDKFKMPNGNISSNGFEALKSMNTNDDLVINENDEIFSKLQVWFDKNHDGITDAGELKTLSELEIVSIGLDWADDGIFYLDDDMNILESQSALVTFKDKTTKKISEFMFPVNTLDSTFEGITTIGNVSSLEYALDNDEDGSLTELFEAFSTEKNIGKKRYYLKQLLYKVTDSEDVDPRGRGDNIDARDLNVIEQFMGSKFDGADGKNPNTVAAATLKDVYASLEEMYYNYANFRSAFFNFRMMTYIRTNEKDFKYIDHSKADEYFDNAIANKQDIDVNIYDYGKYLIYLDKKHKTYSYEGFKSKYSAVSDRFADILALAENSKSFFGTKYDDTLSGSANGNLIFGELGDDILNGNSIFDIIFGNEGNDTLSGGAGNDELHGGTGNDTLNGGTGNDIYFFEPGDGQDTINENQADSSRDIIVFGVGITPNDITVTRDGADMVLLIGTNGDSLRIVNQFTSTIYQIEYFEFSDGSLLDKSEYLGATITIKGSKKFSAPNDKATGKTILVGSYDNDDISGTERTDILRGGAGNDVLSGGAGNDELLGGTGNDTLYGGVDDDIYIFNIGDGQDIINEYNSDSTEDIVMFGEGIVPDDISVTRDGNDMILLVGTNGDSLRIIGQFVNTAYQIESFEFADGTKLDKKDYLGATLRIYISGKFSNPDDKANGITIITGSDENDEIYGNRRKDIIYGEAGNDILCGSGGNDELHGGIGQDKLYGNMGNDTYVFNLGDGQDTINEEMMDSDGDRVLFGAGITPNDITVTRDGADMVLLIGTKGDSLRIVNQFTSTYYQVESFEFANGTKYDKKIYLGTAITINVSGIFSDPDDKATGTTKLIGSDENDEIYGNERKDIIYGEAGDDKLHGGAGNDELHGGTGIDILLGYVDNDTYVFNLGDGQDIINEEGADSSGDRVLFGAGIMPNDITVTKEGADIVLLVGSNEDSLRIANHLTNSAYQVESIEFADGVLAHIDLEASELIIDFDGTTTTANTTTATTTTTSANTTAATTTTTSANTTAATTTTSANTTAATTTTSANTTAATTTTSSATTTTAATTTETTTSNTSALPEKNLGDVNNDGMINAVDASSVLAYYAVISTNQKGNYSDAQKLAADVNNDGMINAVDASIILSYYAYTSTAGDKVLSFEEYLKK